MSSCTEAPCPASSDPAPTASGVQSTSTSVARVLGGLATLGRRSPPPPRRRSARGRRRADGSSCREARMRRHDRRAARAASPRSANGHHADHAGSASRARATSMAPIRAWACGLADDARRGACPAARCRRRSGRGPDQPRILLAEESVADELHCGAATPPAEPGVIEHRDRHAPRRHALADLRQELREDRASRPQACCRPGPPRTRCDRRRSRPAWRCRPRAASQRFR